MLGPSKSQTPDREQLDLRRLSHHLLQPERQYLVIGGVECDLSVLGEKSCAGVKNWWLLKNIVRFNMLEQHPTIGTSQAAAFPHLDQPCVCKRGVV